MKIDPAVASSIFLTTVTDVVGFFTFLGLAAIHPALGPSDRWSDLRAWIPRPHHP